MNTAHRYHFFHGSVFFQHLSLGVFIPTLIYWQHQVGLNFTDIAIIQTIGFFTLLLMEIPSSFLADRKSIRITIALGLLAIVLQGVILSFSTTFAAFLSAQICLSLGLAFLSGTEEAWLHDLTNNTRHDFSKALSRMQIADELGTITGMGLSSLIIFMLSPQWSYFLASSAALVSFLFFISIPKTVATATTEYEDWKIAVQRLGSNHHHLIVLGLFLLLAIVAYRGEILFQAFFVERGIDITALGLVYILGKLGALVGSWITPQMQGMFSTRNTFTIFLALQGGSFLLLMSSLQIVGIGALMLYFCTENVLRNIQKSALLHWAPSKMKATVLSLSSFSSSLIIMIITPIIGFGIDVNMPAVLATVFAVKFLASLLVLQCFQPTSKSHSRS